MLQSSDSDILHLNSDKILILTKWIFLCS